MFQGTLQRVVYITVELFNKEKLLIHIYIILNYEDESIELLYEAQQQSQEETIGKILYPTSDKTECRFQKEIRISGIKKMKFIAFLFSQNLTAMSKVFMPVEIIE